MASPSSPQAHSKSSAAHPAPAPSPAVSAFGVTIADKAHSRAESPEISKKTKQLILVGALLALTVLVLAWQYWPTGPGEDPAVAANPEIKPVLQAEQKKDVAQLKQYAADNNPIVASRAVTALASLGDTSMIDKAAQDRRKEVRLAAISALDKAPDSTKLATLQRFTSDPSPDVRSHALAGLASIPDFQIFEPMMKMLDDPDPSVRNAAVKAIEDKIGLKFRDYDPARPNPAVIARIKATVPKFRQNFDGYNEYKKSQGKK